ncbi:terminal uridylyltransferase 4-like [Haemaphysalis longicornis]
MPRNDTDRRPLESSQKPGNRDRCANAYAGTKHTAAGPKNCQVHEEGGGDVPRGDVRALVNRQSFTQQRLGTPPFHQERRRANSTGGPFGPSSTDRDQREVYRPSRVELETLRQHRILPLRKKSTLFPRAQFYCHLCQRHLDDVGYAEKHIQQDVHLTKKAVSDLRMDVKNLPYPVNIQCGAISDFVQQIAKEHGLTRGEVELRRRIAEDLEAHIKGTLPDVRLMLHGSSVNGFGLKTSKVDIDLSSVGKADSVKLFIETGDLLLQCPKYSNVQTDFFSRVPRIRFTDVSSTLSCKISLNNSNSLKTSRLLEDYVSLDPRVRTLGVAFRFWANICGLDQQEKGTLPAHALALMTVFFLQQCKPAVLPVLHEGKGIDESESYVKPKDLEGRWACKNYRSVGQLWVELLRFYAVEFKLSKHVVCIRKSQPVLIAEKKWNNRYIAIEDPYSPKWNLARSIPSERVYLFVKECLRSSAAYFLLPQLRSGPMFTMLPGPPYYKDDSEFESESDQEEDKVKGKKERQSQLPECSVLTRVNSGDEYAEERGDGAKDNDKYLSFDENVDVVTNRYPFPNPSTKVKVHNTITPPPPQQFVKPGPPIPQRILDELDLCSMGDFHYSFTRKTLAGGKVPPLVCSFCQKSGHLRDDCPDQRLPELKKLPDMTRNFTRILSDVCQGVMNACALQPQEEADRQDLLQELQSLIRESHKDAKLTLYGSSCNGFGLARCDLDICLTFNSSKDGKDISHVRMIKYLARKFYKHPELDEVIAITNAKVPIVKLFHVPSGLEADISLYNRLAQHNTRLLKTYSSIDNRVRELGYTIKRFAKTCDICDASRGSLSSYAYILMTLYYLQQRKPPVIPVLQELYPDGEVKPEVVIEGWNAWFFEDIDRLQNVWSEFGQNKESVGELWLGMLRFYTEEFNFKKHVVCIRQKAPLSKLQKMWNSRCIAIEDPFDLHHNLGIGVSPKMYMYIMKAFIKGRSLFGTPMDKLPPIYSTRVDYFFDSRKLTDGQRPNDRGCHRCGKIGHRVKECPKDWPPRQNVPASAGFRLQRV